MIWVSIRVSAWSKPVAITVRTPEQLVRDGNKKGHDNDAANDEWRVSLLSHFRNKSAQAFSLECCLTPYGDFGDDAGIPRSAGGGTGAGYPKRKDGGEN